MMTRKLVKKWDRRTVDDGTIQAELEQLAHEFMEASGLIRLPGAYYYYYFVVHFCSTELLFCRTQAKQDGSWPVETC